MNPQQEAELFQSVVEENKGLIYKVANAYCKNEEDRKDLVQEIIIQLWHSFHKYDKRYRVSTWMYRIALNVAISFYRKENRRKSISMPVSADILHFISDTENEEVEDNIKLLQQFINELKELDKALILLYLEEKSHKEMAEILGLSETNIATKIGRIKKKLKQRFSTINKEMTWKNKN